MKILIVSEHRCGSRWLHYLLADLLYMNVSPEKDGRKLQETNLELRQYLNHKRIAKVHHGLVEDILTYVKPNDYKIVGIVRNPRDRAVSRAFHDLYHKHTNYPVKKLVKTDFEAVKFIVLDQDQRLGDHRQLQLMKDNYSTRIYKDFRFPYIWTSYEWMKDDVGREIRKILEFLDSDYKTMEQSRIDEVIERHNFKNSSGREPGQEIRTDTWRRKGKMLDWINWFDLEMLEHSKDIQEEYWTKLIKNGGRS